MLSQSLISFASIFLSDFAPRFNNLNFCLLPPSFCPFLIRYFPLVRRQLRSEAPNISPNLASGQSHFALCPFKPYNSIVAYPASRWHCPLTQQAIGLGMSSGPNDFADGNFRCRGRRSNYVTRIVDPVGKAGLETDVLRLQQVSADLRRPRRFGNIQVSTYQHPHSVRHVLISAFENRIEHRPTEDEVRA